MHYAKETDECHSPVLCPGFSKSVESTEKPAQQGFFPGLIWGRGAATESHCRGTEGWWGQTDCLTGCAVPVPLSDLCSGQGVGVTVPWHCCPGRERGSPVSGEGS